MLVYDQGSCGSCYAYAVTGALENLVAVKANNPLRLRSLSEQQILDCGNDQKNNIGTINWYLIKKRMKK